MRLLLMPTHSSHEDDNGDCDYAVVTITPTLLRNIRTAHRHFQKLKQAMPDVAELTLRSTTCQYLSYTDAARLFGEEHLPEFGGTHTILPHTDLDLGMAAQRTDCDRLCLDETDIWWETVARHSSIHIGTPNLRITDPMLKPDTQKTPKQSRRPSSKKPRMS